MSAIHILLSVGATLVVALQADRTKIVAVSLGTFLGRTHAGQHILLHDDPASVPNIFQLLYDCWEVDIPVAQFAEHAVFDGLDGIPLVATGLFGNPRIMIFEVDMPHAVGVSAQPLDGIAPAKTVVTGIKYQAQYPGVRHT